MTFTFSAPVHHIHTLSLRLFHSFVITASADGDECNGNGISLDSNACSYSTNQRNGGYVMVLKIYIEWQCTIFTNIKSFNKL